jgi:hypothetical protein
MLLRLFKIIKGLVEPFIFKEGIHINTARRSHLFFQNEDCMLNNKVSLDDLAQFIVMVIRVKSVACLCTEQLTGQICKIIIWSLS